MSKHIGSSLNDFLEEDGLLAESELVAVKRIIAFQVEKSMNEKSLSKTKMAEYMGTSRAALDRLLDPSNTAMTLHTLEKATRAIGRKLHVSIS